MWAAGTAAAAGVVAYWRIVGPGYTWLTGATVAALGGAVWFFSPGPVAGLGVAAGAAAVVLARRPVAAAGSLAVATLAFLGEASAYGSPVLAVTGSLALGGITAEMLLGHWYLVSPQMPRWALQRLDVAGAAGIVIDVILLVVLGAAAGVGGIGVVAFFGLAGMSLILMVAVWFSLKEPSYPGVMAATGLSYLAVLTALGSTAIGRTLLDGSGSFLPFQ